jgi:hypothetical protein
MRRVLALAIGLTFLLIAADAAWADKPERFPLGPTDGTLEGVCPFPVGIEDVQNNQVVKVFSDGRTTIGGGYKLRLTNLSTGKSGVFNAPGTITLIPNADGTLTTIGTGRLLFYFLPGERGPGDPGGFFYLSGRIVELTTPDYSQFVSVEHVGTSENLCVTLA